MTPDFLTWGMLAILAVLIFMMFRNNRKRQAEARELQAKLVPGARIITTFGLYGTLVSMDEEQNLAVVETSPGVKLELHRQSIGRVVEPTEPAESASPSDSASENE